MRFRPEGGNCSPASLPQRAVWRGLAVPNRKGGVQDAKKMLEEKFKTGKNRWFFTKLRF